MARKSLVELMLDAIEKADILNDAPLSLRCLRISLRCRVFCILVLGVNLWSMPTMLAYAAYVPFANSGFETYPAGGDNDWRWNGDSWGWDWVGSVAHGGVHSVRVSRSSSGDPATDSLWSPHVSVQPSTVYTLTYWLRSQDPTAYPSVSVYQYTSTGSQTGPRLRSYADVDEGVGNWLRIRFRFQTMPDADYVQVRIFLWASTRGTFWFDDFALEEGPPALYPFQDGFPVEASGWIRFSSPVVADIDGDHSHELLAGAGGWVDGWNETGGILPNFPIPTGDARILGQLALADLEGDGDLEIVAGTRARTYGEQGRVFVWHHTGAEVSGWPKSVAWIGQHSVAHSEVTSVALGDVDGDGDLEVLASTTNGAPGYSGTDPPAVPNLYAWHTDGTLLEGHWPTWYRTAAIFGAIAVGDLNADGIADIVTGRDHFYLHAYAGDGSFLPCWPISTFLDGNEGVWLTDTRLEHINSAPVIADLDNDGAMEYIVASFVSDPGSFLLSNSGVLVMAPDGTRRPGWETAAVGEGVLFDEFLSRQAPVVADLDGDGQFEIVVATFDGWIRAYKADQSLLWAFNYAQGETLFASEPVIGDIDGDQALEILFGTYDPTFGQASAGLWGLRADGTPMPGFPLPVGTPGIRAAPTLADLDHDRDLEILAATWTGKIFVWDTPSPYISSRLPWPMGRHDLQRTATVVREDDPLAPDLSESLKFSRKPALFKGETTQFVIRLHNKGSKPFTHTVWLTDTLPTGLTYVPGSLTASVGTVDDTGGLLRWHGVMSDATTIDISYAVVLTTDAWGIMSNPAAINTVVDGTITRTSYVIANGWLFYMPVVVKKAS